MNLTKKEFIERSRRGELFPLASQIPYADPAHSYEALVGSAFCPSRVAVLLESVKGPLNIARYSFIAFDPYLVMRVKDGEVRLHAPHSGKESVSFRPPLIRLQELLDVYPQKADPQLPPFQGGAAGLFSYDFVRYIEAIPQSAHDDLLSPDAHFLLVDRVIAFDHLQKKAWIIVAPGARDTELGYRDTSTLDWSAAYDEATEVIQKGNTALKECRVPEEGGDRLISSSLSLSTSSASTLNYELSKKQYMEMVQRAKEYIAAGDIFQANLSQRISAPIGSASPWDIYKVLRAVNPSPFAGYADFSEYQIVSSSPERLVKVQRPFIETRPIAGTRPRGKDSAEDEEMRVELLLNEKERAEHIMLIDLERNDVGKVSEYGSVVVDELMITESYSHVIHIVSNIKGALRNACSCTDAIRATFPGGTITGVPKVRCMEIIDELEPVRRGPYTGSLGYLSFSGAMDLNIIIRTFLIKEGVAYVHAGAGIVADSDPGREYYETLKKAEALVRTLEKTTGAR